MRPKLASLIIKSLERLPDLQPGQDCITSFSWKGLSSHDYASGYEIPEKPSEALILRYER